MKQTAVDFLFDAVYKDMSYPELLGLIAQAKEMEKKQLFLASKTSAKEAYEAGQQSMYCGCYDIDGCTSYKEWLYEQFESEQDDNNI